MKNFLKIINWIHGIISYKNFNNDVKDSSRRHFSTAFLLSICPWSYQMNIVLMLFHHTHISLQVMKWTGCSTQIQAAYATPFNALFQHDAKIYASIQPTCMNSTSPLVGLSTLIGTWYKHDAVLPWYWLTGWLNSMSMNILEILHWNRYLVILHLDELVQYHEAPSMPPLLALWDLANTWMPQQYPWTVVNFWYRYTQIQVSKNAEHFYLHTQAKLKATN